MEQKYEVTTYLNYIGGRWVPSDDGDLLDSINPATGELVARAQNSRKSDVDAAVEAAREAFDKEVWRSRRPHERSSILRRIAESLRANVETLGVLLTRENGKPLADARGEILNSANVFDYYAATAGNIVGRIPRYSETDVSLVVYEPVGVCGLIVPWNSPISLLSWKLGPVFASGCTAVVKPSEHTPAITNEFMKILDSIGELPKGVVNVVTGPGEPVGSELVKHPAADKISFTGSTETGRKIREMSSVNLKKINLECGGKSANVILDDANFEAALKGAFWGIFRSAGQSCNAGSRLLIQDTIYEKFLSEVVRMAKKVRVGNGLNTETEIGPLISDRQLDRVLLYIKSGIQEGAKLVYGGRRLVDGELAKGFFLEPTIFENVARDMKIFQEEIFGPVLCVVPFHSDQEAVEIANDTKYGLAGNIWSRNMIRIMRIAQGMRTGTVWVNRHLNPGPEVPFGGYKQSGIGRETGLEGLMEYMQIKHISLNLTEGFERVRR